MIPSPCPKTDIKTVQRKYIALVFFLKFFQFFVPYLKYSPFA